MKSITNLRSGRTFQDVVCDLSRVPDALVRGHVQVDRVEVSGTARFFPERVAAAVIPGERPEAAGDDAEAEVAGEVNGQGVAEPGIAPGDEDGLVSPSTFCGFCTVRSEVTS